MLNSTQVYSRTHGEVERGQKQLEQVDSAIAALGSLDGRRGRKIGRRSRPRHMSIAARRRIAAAQKARWAKIRERRGKKVGK